MITDINKEAYKKFVEGLSFNDAVEFFNFIICDMMQEENHAMYDIFTKQGLTDLLNQNIDVDMEGIYRELAMKYPIKVVVVWSINNGLSVCESKEMLLKFSDWFLSHLEELNNGEKDRTFIDEKYPKLLTFLFGRGKLINCLTRMIEMLERNRKRLTDGLTLENEHWTDISMLFREHLEAFGNFNQK